MGRAESKSRDCSSHAWAVGRYGMREELARGIEGFLGGSIVADGV